MLSQMTGELHPWDQAFGVLPPNWSLHLTLCFGLHHYYLCFLSKIRSQRSPSCCYTYSSGKPRCGLYSRAVPSTQADAPYNQWERGNPAPCSLPCPTCTSSEKRSIILCLWQPSFPSVRVTGCDFPVPMTPLLFGLFSAQWVSTPRSLVFLDTSMWHKQPELEAQLQETWESSVLLPQSPCLYSGSGSHSNCLMGSSWG